MTKQPFLFTEKYRPPTIDELILPQYLKDEFNRYIEQKTIPNLLMVGRAGVGKTSAALAMIKAIKADHMLINCSLEGNLDTLRNDIKNFATTVSFTGKRKYVILDEIDSTSSLFQPALRTFMEQYSSNCGFILTANHRNKVIRPVQSRCSIVSFKFPATEKVSLIQAYTKRLFGILKAEGIEYDKLVVGQLVIKFYPDFRAVLHELQRYRKIDNSVLAILNVEGSFKQLIQHIKEKDFTNARKWVGEHSDVSPTELYSTLYKNCSKYFQPQSVPQLIVLLGEYQYKSTFVVDQEINTSAFLAEVMAQCSVK